MGDVVYKLNLMPNALLSSALALICTQTVENHSPSHSVQNGLNFKNHTGQIDTVDINLQGP